MLNRTFAYDLALCDNCEKWIIYKIVDGLPNSCPKCGVPANHTVTREEREQINQRNEFIKNYGGGNGGTTFHFRRG